MATVDDDMLGLFPPGSDKSVKAGCVCVNKALAGCPLHDLETRTLNRLAAQKAIFEWPIIRRETDNE